MAIGPRENFANPNPETSHSWAANQFCRNFTENLHVSFHVLMNKLGKLLDWGNFFHFLLNVKVSPWLSHKIPMLARLDANDGSSAIDEYTLTKNAHSYAIWFVITTAWYSVWWKTKQSKTGSHPECLSFVGQSFSVKYVGVKFPSVFLLTTTSECSE